MSLLLLFLSYFFVLFCSIKVPFTTVIENKASVDGISLTLYNNLPVVSYYDTYDRHIKIIRCYNPDCSSNETISIENGNRKSRQNNVGVDADGTIYVDFFDLSQNVLRLGVLFPNHLSLILNLDSSWTNFLSTYSDMLILNNKNPIVIYKDRFQLKYALCSDLPYCENKKVELLYDFKTSFAEVYARLDLSGYLNICTTENSGIKYLRCYDIDCTNKTISDISSSLFGQYFLECAEIDINPLTNFAGFFLVDKSKKKIAFSACQDLACTTYITSIFSFVNSSYISGRYDKSGIPHIIYPESSTKYLMAIDCFDSLCSEENVTFSLLDNSGNFEDAPRLELDETDQKVIIYREKEDSSLHYFRYLDTPTPTQNPTLAITKSPTKAKTEIKDFLKDPKKAPFFYVPFGAIIICFIVCIYVRIQVRGEITSIAALQENTLDDQE